MKIAKKICALALTSVAMVSIASCSNNGESTGYSNDSTPLIFSSQQVDRVFNPFFSTNAADSNIVSMTQISMLTTKNRGEIAYGDDQPVVVLDLEETTTGTGDDQITTYKFVLKNNVKFSNGSPLTIKDVLFNMYVYLDPVYTGSNTMYSTDIVGLSEYRTQTSDKNEQDAFESRFGTNARQRIDDLIAACTEILRDTTVDYTIESFKTALAAYAAEENGTYSSKYVSDFEKTCTEFETELNTDYTNSIDTYEDITFTDRNDNVYKNLLNSDVEAFLCNAGYITFNRTRGELEYAFGEECKTWTKEQAINTVLQAMLPNSIEQVLRYWATATTMYTHALNELKEEYYSNLTESGNRDYSNVSGITFANMNSPVDVNGKTYAAPQYGEDKAVSNNTNEVLQIQIKGVDPKAIWNFAFQVAPMYYYSDAEHIEAFDFVNNFGVEYGSTTFMQTVLNAPEKVSVPVGAGAYQASNSAGETGNITAGDFCSANIMYFARNEYFIMGAPEIKYINYQVVSTNAMLNVLYNNEVDFVQPNAKPETVTELEGKESEGIGSDVVTTMGYGYIGINAGKIPSIKVRQAIMHSIDTSLTISYYLNTAEPIYRSMSKESWAYPEGCTPYYPFIGGEIPEDLSVVNPDYKNYIESLGKSAGEKLTTPEQEAFIRGLLADAGYSEGNDGIYVDANGNNKCQFAFTIAGAETDHPAFQSLWQAGEFLNKIGFKITTSPRSDALSQLSSGGLAVWAAAWTTTIDPDMYQVYHKDSNATSVLNWGYPQILANPNNYTVETEIINELSDLIESGRSYTEQNVRSTYYKEALDKVMELAVELPTYQRKDLYAYNTNKIDVTSMTPSNQLSAYVGLTDKIWEIRLNEIK